MPLARENDSGLEHLEVNDGGRGESGRRRGPAEVAGIDCSVVWSIWELFAIVVDRPIVGRFWKSDVMHRSQANSMAEATEAGVPGVSGRAPFAGHRCKRHLHVTGGSSR